MNNGLSPGDVLVMSAAIESIAMQYPGKYVFTCNTTCPEIFDNNPHCSPVRNFDFDIQAHYPNIHRSNQELTHYLDGYTQDIAGKLGITVRLSTNRPHIYLSPEELAKPRQVEGRYCVVCSGYKSDYTVKNWGFDNWQALTDWVISQGIQVVQVGEGWHNHERLRGAIDLIGQTNIRQLFLLSYHAEFGMGHESLLHHVFAAYQKPFVCVASGWNGGKLWCGYPTEVYLSRQGSLDCCKVGGCWRGRVDIDCLHPDKVGSEAVGLCMRLISPSEATQAIETWYKPAGVLYKP